VAEELALDAPALDGPALDAPTTPMMIALLSF